MMVLLIEMSRCLILSEKRNNLYQDETGTKTGVYRCHQGQKQAYTGAIRDKGRRIPVSYVRLGIYLTKLIKQVSLLSHLFIFALIVHKSFPKKRW